MATLLLLSPLLTYVRDNQLLLKCLACATKFELRDLNPVRVLAEIVEDQTWTIFDSLEQKCFANRGVGVLIREVRADNATCRKRAHKQGTHQSPLD